MKKLVKPAKVIFQNRLSNAVDFIFGFANDVAADLAKAIAAGHVAKVLSYRPAVGDGRAPAHYAMRKI